MINFDVQLMKSANNCWDLFNAVPQDIKTRIITLGLIELALNNFKGSDRKLFCDLINGRR